MPEKKIKKDLKKLFIEISDIIQIVRYLFYLLMRTS